MVGQRGMKVLARQVFYHAGRETEVQALGKPIILTFLRTHQELPDWTLTSL